MIAVLETILGVITSLPDLALYALETVVNAIFGGAGAALTFALGLLPQMPSISEAIPGEYLEAANWFYPFSAVLAFAVSCVVMYGSWLVVRWFLRMVRAA